jgi:enoyl-CoA hydratase/carnithine racemase
MAQAYPALQHIVVSVEERVGWLAYHRPPINAFNRAMVEEVVTALQALLDDPAVRVIVIASRLERFFSAGADLQVFQGMSAEQMRDWVSLCHVQVGLLRGSRKPLLAAIHGAAVGGGLEAVLHCDVRFCAEDARLGQPEVNIAFIPPVGGTQGLARLLGRPRALRFLYDGNLVSAQEALALGLVDELVPPQRLKAHVQAYAAALARKPAEALAAIRRCITEGGALPFAEGLAIEQEEAARLGATPDFVEGVAAFIVKRPPRFA